MGFPSGFHVLVSAIGSAGDVNPFVAIGRELRRRGHRVTLITNGHFEPVAARAGLDFVALGTVEEYRTIVDDPALWDPRNGFRVLVRRVLVPATKALYEILSRHLDPRTVLVAQGQTFGAHVAHDKHGVPFITIQLQPAVFRSAFDAPLVPAWIPRAARPALYRVLDYFVFDRELAGEVNAFRAQLGLTPVHRLFDSWIHSPEGTIGLFPDWFAHPQPDWPPRTELTGFVFLTEAPAALESPLAAFLSEGDPPLVFTAGTAMRHADTFFGTALVASSELGRRALFITPYADQLPSPLPAGVAAFAHVPLAAVLPRCAALVHHGGIGTAAQALAAGIPQLVRPAAFDQPDNAARLQRIGVGGTVRPTDFRPRVVADLLRKLLDSTDVATRCRAYAAMIQPETALAHTCDAIERIAGSRIRQ